MIVYSIYLYSLIELWLYPSTYASKKLLYFATLAVALTLLPAEGLGASSVFVLEDRRTYFGFGCPISSSKFVLLTNEILVDDGSNVSTKVEVSYHTCITQSNVMLPLSWSQVLSLKLFLVYLEYGCDAFDRHTVILQIRALMVSANSDPTANCEFGHYFQSANSNTKGSLRIHILHQIANSNTTGNLQIRILKAHCKFGL
ncbi:hypothetical protein Tco_1153799 [Tanacetum coccineum]